MKTIRYMFALCLALRNVREEKAAFNTGIRDVVGRPIKKGDLVMTLHDRALRHVHYNGIDACYEAVRLLPYHQPSAVEVVPMGKDRKERFFKVNG